VEHLDENLLTPLTAEGEAHLAGCERCQTELLALVGLSVGESQPSPLVLERLLESVQPGRFSLVVDRLARFFDVTRDRARALLDRLDSRWLDGPAPGIWLQHAKPGPRLEGRYAGFFRLAPGVPFPAHRHLGPESMLVLEGSVRVSSGELVSDGEVLDSSAGSAHDFQVAGDDDCIAAVIQEGGLEFGIKL
jgi:hypothetical protein